MRKLIALLILVPAVLAFAIPALAQDQTLITLTAEAGFDGYFRDGQWLPISVRLTNAGDDVSGRLVVRPETSGAGITNTYSTPITLPRGGDQTATLYITARAFTTQIRLELIDEAGVVVAQTTTNARSIQTQDRLHVVITESAVGSIDLSAVKTGIFNAYQANWTVAQVPDRAAALDAVDLLMFSEADTGSLNEAQREALRDWVVSGGHLLVTGGANWQATSAAFNDLLPLDPQNSQTVETLAPLADWLNVSADDLNEQAIISTGDLVDGAVVLAGGDLPLIVRRTLGGGTVDYLTMNPTDAPLRGWGSVGDLWFALATSLRAQPSWTNGVLDWDSATRAVEILPGYDPLPDILPLCGFLAAYIGLIGPLNYLILNRINRREWAWVTIPVCIVAFSALAWTLGANLRGNEATLNRLAVVQVWDDTERARVDGLIGLLSPRRAPYSLSGGDEALRPIPRPNNANTFLTTNTQSSIDIVQRDGFAAENFTVDASFIAGFNLTSMVDAPAVRGSGTIRFEEVAGQQRVVGSISNDSDITLTEPILLARGVALELGAPIQPGDVRPFDLILSGTTSPAPVLRTLTGVISFTSRTGAFMNKQTVQDILRLEGGNMGFTRLIAAGTPEEQATQRRQLFLSSFIDDVYGTTGRGDRLYLAAWSDQAPLSLDVQGANWNAQDTTLYLVELDTTLDAPSSTVTISPDQFTWVVRDYVGMGDVSPVTISMQPGEEVVFQYTPLPDAVLSEVDELLVQIQNINIGGRTIPAYLWDWQAGDWEEIRVVSEVAVIPDPQRYLGAQNAVRLRFISEDTGGYLRAGRITISQTGRYE